MALVTLDEYKIYTQKSQSDTKDDDRINVIIDQVTDMVESYCGRKFAAADYEEYHDGGYASIFVTNFPILNLASVEEYDGVSYNLLGNPDPTNGSFINTVGGAHAPSGLGNANVSTRTSKFNGSSCKLDGVGDYLSVTDSADFHFETEAFSVEAQVNFSNTSAIHTIASHGTDASNYWSLELDFLNTKGLVFRVVESGSETLSIIEQSSANYTVGNFYHAVVSRSGNTFKIFSDGREANTVSSSVSLPNFTGSFEVGRNSELENNFLRGYVDEVRVSWDSRYTDDFTAPTFPYATDIDTKLLMHMDGLSLTNAFADSSRNVNQYSLDSSTGEVSKSIQGRTRASILGHTTFSNYPNAIKIKYQGGFATLPNDLKNVALELCKLYYKGFEGISSMSLQGESMRRATPMKDGFPPHIRRVLSLYKVY
jgi:hypothetical protein